MAIASLAIGVVAGLYMLLAASTALPLALRAFNPVGITCLVVVGLALGVLAVTRSRSCTRFTCLLPGSAGILLSLVVLVAIGIAAG